MYSILYIDIYARDTRFHPSSIKIPIRPLVENWLIFSYPTFLYLGREFFTSGGDPLGKKYSLDIKRRDEKANFPPRYEITILNILRRPDYYSFIIFLFFLFLISILDLYQY